MEKMDRKTYMKRIYSKYWINARENKYGFSIYDKQLCALLVSIVNPAQDHKQIKLLEVAVGTGYPFADHFDKMGYEVHGVDISDELVNKCRTSYPSVKANVGDAESLQYGDDYFDATYCFHSTWYFPDLKKALCEMFRVTRFGGFVVFDIQNRSNRFIEVEYKKRLNELSGLGKIKRCAINCIKVLSRRGYPLWGSVNHDTPAYPQDIYKYIRECGYGSHVTMYLRENDDIIEAREGFSCYENHDRIIIVANKLTSKSI